MTDMSAGRSRMPRLGYLINQYPKVSHTFIRREIEAVERHGVSVSRFALRGWDADVVDPSDIAEKHRTRYTLDRGLLPLFGGVARVALSRPKALLAAFRASAAMARKSERALAYHFAYVAHACQLLRWTSEDGIEHLHVHFGTNATEVAMLLRILGGPTYSFTVHGSEEFEKADRLGLDKTIANAAFVVTVNAYGRAQMMRHANVEDWPKIHEVHCGLEADYFTLRPPSDRRRLVAVGRLSREKGHLLLVQAFAAIATEFPDADLVVAGDGVLRDDIEAHVRALGLDGRVTVTGWVDTARVREEITAARAMVLPSFMESLPVVLMEAMALGRPVIASRVCGIPELVEHGRTGWLITPGDTDALAAAMRQALTLSDDECRRMGEAAFARVVERHAIDREVLALLKLFQTKAGQAASRDPATPTDQGVVAQFPV
jgi:colanic acid/amylovoran biosynthesis glycosyltransferase